MTKLCWYCEKRMTDEVETYYFYSTEGRKTVAENYERRIDEVKYRTDQVEIPTCTECYRTKEMFIGGWVAIAIGIVWLLLMGSVVLLQPSPDGTSVVWGLALIGMGIVPVVAGAGYIWRLKTKAGMKYLSARSNFSIRFNREHGWHKGLSPTQSAVTTRYSTVVYPTTCSDCKSKRYFLYCRTCGRVEWWFAGAIFAFGLLCILIALAGVYNYHNPDTQSRADETIFFSVCSFIPFIVVGAILILWTKRQKKPLPIVLFVVSLLVIGVLLIIGISTLTDDVFFVTTRWNWRVEDLAGHTLINYQADNNAQYLTIMLRKGRLVPSSAELQSNLGIEITTPEGKVVSKEETVVTMASDRVYYFHYIDDSVLTGAPSYMVHVFLDGKEVETIPYTLR